MQNNDLELLVFDNPIKATARCRKKKIVKTESGKIIVEKAENNTQLFYLERNCVFERKFAALEFIEINTYNSIEKIKKNKYVTYKFFENIEEVKFEQARFYADRLASITKSELNKEYSLECLLSSWPDRYRNIIKLTDEYQKYKEELYLGNYKKCVLEHGDFTKNNIVKFNGTIYLIDFEFSREHQPNGFDLLDLYRTYGKKGEINIDNYKLNSLKYDLVTRANTIVDSDESIISVGVFSSDLKYAWEKLIPSSLEKVSYNGTFTWCSKWIKYFGNEYQPNIVLSFKNGNLLSITPLYVYKNNLRVIGTYPDLYDQCSFIYSDEKCFKDAIEYIYSLNFSIEIKHTNTSLKSYAIIYSFLYSSNITYKSFISDVIPLINKSTFKLKKKQRDDKKRNINNLKLRENLDSKFEYQDISDNVIEELVELHKSRWNGGPFDDIPKLKQFLIDISKSDLSIISTLYFGSKKTAIHFAYVNTDGSITSAIPSYSTHYSSYSPGKILIQSLIEKSIEDEVSIDFGRGAEVYKSWFANDSQTLANINIYQCNSLQKIREKFNFKMEIIIEKLYANLRTIIR
ncbi:GNAT family N-acetyltransferase [Vibrio artabrorum]|uniref:GNAT family N-acetyltransferase n=1 Tax=Vibrio artabrorum TaxID=446374 RepID=A0ABT8CFE2_9VIBR|nr:GNAT family N-acetyltransferase [Vibrio artabrorum]MDN3700447.1 GNAT family N-acetyltransferase [Vibrio artabrorum]